VIGMELDWNAELLGQLEGHWENQLRPRFDGLSDDEYFWEPVPDCWSLRRDRLAGRGGPAARPLPPPVAGGLF
jgi:hypothetical protein